ncbi:MAG: hypothetical protein KA099_02880 [Alphaproteobacteria bacterium]|nr:hypothetical protein [Alphaproteobacteria bacterium]MBP7759547.1 hypothetical protein [Alphaproteobacteria bacterium]MBP7762944.1 hypothetical protein [Alphaproteobacteria bacterium]MBP7904247.1 hypothetical protein [Alphaproteobacteria bacterium]
MKVGFIKAVFALLILLSPLKVWAVDKLTEENIREHYQKSIAVVKENNKGKRLDFINTHYHPDLIVTKKFPIAGKDGTLSESFETNTTRQQFIDQLLNAPKSEISFLEYDILDIVIRDDAKSALVKDREKVSLCGDNCFSSVVVNECDDEIILSPEGIIQLYKATCGWVVPEEFKKKQP